MSEKLVQALFSSACYPHTTGKITLLETHISWVLLTGDVVYKIKKPVNFGFLDFSTLAKRKHYCEEELRLNSRFDTGLYLGVVAIAGSEEAPRIVALDDESVTQEGDDKVKHSILDYAVKMREFDQRCLLDKLAIDDGLNQEDIKTLGRQLANFHQHKAARLESSDDMRGTVASVRDAALDNFSQILPRLNTTQARRELECLQQWTQQQLEILQDIFIKRREQGFVRECHGDLHLGNIARINGDITFFDCIEFNEQFRWIDLMSELAFLLMDMDEKKLRGHSNRLLNIYLEYSGDYAGLAVLQFYKVYRAMVRAKVMVLKVDGRKMPGEDADLAWDEYNTYIRLAQSYCNQSKPFLGLMHGISGTGKSTVAATLAGQCGAIRLRSDVERKRLYGLAPEANSKAEDKLQLYSKEASARTFARLEILAGCLLDFGYPVLVDATFIAAKWRHIFLQLGIKHKVPSVIIDCQASQATLIRRLEQRLSSGKGASEAGVEVMQSQLKHIEPFTAVEQPFVLVIDTEAPVDADVLQRFLQKLKSDTTLVGHTQHQED